MQIKVDFVCLDHFEDVEVRKNYGLNKQMRESKQKAIELISLAKYFGIKGFAYDLNIGI